MICWITRKSASLDSVLFTFQIQFLVCLAYCVMPHLSHRSFAGIHEVSCLHLPQIRLFPLQDIAIREDADRRLEDLLWRLPGLIGLNPLQRREYLGYHVDVHLILWSEVLPSAGKALRRAALPLWRFH